MKIGIGDGFRFGCGFFLAILVAQIIAAVIIVILAVAGVSILPNITRLFQSGGGLIP